MKKILIIGCPGSGKSTFARALREITGIELFHLDMMYWNPDKTIVEPEIFRQRLADAMAGEAWIIDGNFQSTMSLRMERCDTVIFLDYPPEVCLEGVRARMGKKRSDMPWVETEEDTEFMVFIEKFVTQNRPQVLELLENFSNKEIHIFKTREEAEAFLSLLKNRKEVT